MKTKRNGIIAAVLILCGALGLTTGCKSGNTNIQQVKGTLEAKVVDDSVPAKVREAMDLAYEGRYEMILDDTASHVSVWSLLRCNHEVSSEGFGIHVVKDKQVTKMPEMRHGNNPKARYDSQSGNLWMACAAMEGTGVLVERLHLLRFHDDGTAYSVATIDPYEMQQALCQRLGFTIDSMNITFYDRQQALGTVTNTITDMGGFDADDPVWIGEQMSYDISGDSIRVKIVPGIKFTTGLVFHYEEMPTLSAKVSLADDGTFTIGDISFSPEEEVDTYLKAVERYLTDNKGKQYRSGQVCIPYYTVVGVDESNADDIKVWGDFWLDNYNISGDTLLSVSGGSHPGLMHVSQKGESFEVTSFDAVGDGSQFLPTAKKIFGDKFDAFQKVNSDDKKRNEVRRAAVAEYVKSHRLPVKMYKDYGWDPVKF